MLNVSFCHNGSLYNEPAVGCRMTVLLNVHVKSLLCVCRQLQLHCRQINLVVTNESQPCFSKATTKMRICYGSHGKYALKYRHTVYPETIQRGDFTSFCQPTRLITYADHGNHVEICIKSRQSMTYRAPTRSFLFSYTISHACMMSHPRGLEKVVGLTTCGSTQGTDIRQHFTV